MDWHVSRRSQSSARDESPLSGKPFVHSDGRTSNLTCVFVFVRPHRHKAPRQWPGPSLEGRRPGLFPSSWRALQYLSFAGAYLSLCLLLPALGARLRHTSPSVRIAVSAVAMFLLLYQTVWDGWVRREWLFLWMFFGFGEPWVPVLLVVMTTVIFRHRGSQQRPGLQNYGTSNLEPRNL